MSQYKSLFKQTAIYGLATVLPRMFSFLLIPIHIAYLRGSGEYGQVSIIFSYLIFFNVILSYGMETSFFRFYTDDNNKKSVVNTSMLSIFWTSLIFLAAGLVFRNTLAEWADKNVEYITYTIWILVLDALVIIPFAKLRVNQRPIRYAIIKVGSVALYFVLNIFFLKFLPDAAAAAPDSFLATLYIENYGVGYIFLANIIVSVFTLVVLLPDYFKVEWKFDTELWKRMMRYGLPVMIAGIAFAINEGFDRLLLDYLGVPESVVGAYSGCYKLAVFMVLFATAFRLGVEPFFFSHAKNENAPQTYAMITKYFIILGSVILLVVIVFADILKLFMIPDPGYWEAMKVVPLIILGNFFLGIYHNLSVWYKLSDKTKIGAYISVVGAIITLALNFALIPIWSYMGSAVATIAAYGSMMLISYFLGNKYYPIPYDMKKIGGYLGLSIGLSLAYFYIFRENYYIGVTAILLYAGYVYVNEKETLMRIIGRK
ncbi:MAG: polysaccharide biosynthesis protein [Flavobacterium sp.]|nr:MAG: polysaccharide biosynthesis protein [Flavobacterium sp.]